MLTRQTIILDTTERVAVEAVAEREFRSAREQIRVFVREGLERRGVLPTNEQYAQANKATTLLDARAT